MNLKGYRRVLAVCLIICFILTGCTDATEIDDEVYTLAIGIDKGSGNNFKITVQYPTYKGGSKGVPAGGGGKESKESGEVDGTIVTTVEAPSILEAINLMNTSVGRRISLMHSKIVVFSEEIARQGVSKYLAPITRFREARRIMRVVISKTSAEDLLRNFKTLIGESTPKGLELLFNQTYNNALFPEITLHEFYKDLSIGYEQPFAIYAALNPLDGTGGNEQQTSFGEPNTDEFLAGKAKKIGGPKVEFIGTAVFHQDKMTGILDGRETRFFSMVTGKFERAAITLEDLNMNDRIIVFDIRKGRSPRIDLDFINGKPVIKIYLNIESDIESIQSRIPYEGLNMIVGLEEQLKAYIKKGVKDMIKKTQTEFDADIVGFGRKAALHFSTIKEWDDYKWLSHYKEADVNVDVEVNIRRTGLIYKAAPLKHN